ncbi:PAS domain S-box protein, partial [bacterium]|nr:PAS domain S-box protein [bacterium]
MIEDLSLVVGIATLTILLMVLGVWLFYQNLRKRTHELAASQEKYRVLAENSSDGVLLVQEERALVTNRRAEEILGYSPEKLAQLQIMDIFQNVDGDLFGEDEDSLKPLKRIQRADGQDRWTRLTSLPVEWENKPATMLVIKDVTGQIQTREAVRETEKKFTDAFLAIPDAVIITTLQDGRFVAMNKSFEKITGYSPEDLSKQNVLEIGLWIQPEDREWLVEQLRLYGQVVGMEMKARIKNGEIHFGFLSARLIEIQGEPCIVTIVRDMTDKKSTEERFRQQMQRLATLRVVDMTIAASMELDQVLNLLL